MNQPLYPRYQPEPSRLQRLRQRLGQMPLPGTPRQRKLLFLVVFGLFLVLEISGTLLAAYAPVSDPAEPKSGKPAKKKSAAALQADNAQLQRKIRALAPSGLYIVIDTAGNRVYLKRGEETLKEMLASCGSGNVLEDPVGGRTWTFDTPRGDFRILKKVTKPVWIKPDWAFLEEGEPIPERSSERNMPGMMGNYALGIGDGYYIHGTLYSRLLGRNVSHGCVRLGDADLEELYRSADLGTRVLIY
jgi:lipoprotein-anchoring transpeptidase ErfK/SrfK